MRSSIRKAYAPWALALITFSLAAQTHGPRYTGNSPRAFIEAFYAWYVPRALAEDTTAGWNATLRLIRAEMSPHLAKLLAKDVAAQAQCKELVGLDFDPFLNTQEPAERYEVGAIRRSEGDYEAEIYSIRRGRRSEKPDVIVHFRQENRHWFFVDFSYPSDRTDLITILESPRLPCSEPRVAH